MSEATLTSCMGSFFADSRSAENANQLDRISYERHPRVHVSTLETPS